MPYTTASPTTKITKTTLSPIPDSSSPKPKDPITCHVLDLTTGLPAAGIAVSLNLLRPVGPSAPFRGLTDSDGRISNWNIHEGYSLGPIFENLHKHANGRTVWELVFQTGEYFGEGRTFFPEVRVGFFVESDGGKEGNDGGKKGHYHVPLLLGPWSYTTYRGS